MSDTIDRQAAIDALARFVPYAICDESTESYTNGLTDAYNLILQLPSVQPERKKGKWMEENTRSASYIFKCSCCGKNAYFVHGKGRGRNCENRYCGYDFCPNCGANMRGE